jgi:hypothetical protein
LKAKDLLRTVEAYSRQKSKIFEEITQEMLRELPDEQFRMSVMVAAELFLTLKAEAIRRGIWDELKTKKVKGV